MGFKDKKRFLSGPFALGIAKNLEGLALRAVAKPYAVLANPPCARRVSGRLGLFVLVPTLGCGLTVFGPG